MRAAQSRGAYGSRVLHIRRSKGEGGGPSTHRVVRYRRDQVGSVGVSAIEAGEGAAVWDVVLVHGEPRAQDALALKLRERDFPSIHVPARGDLIRF